MVISNQTSESLDILVGGFFSLNRTTDRISVILQNKFAMPNAANIIHHNIAHLYPLLADEVTKIKDNYNLPSVYPETHRDARDYENLSDMFTQLLKENLDVYEMMKMTYQVAHENGDFNVMADLVELMRKFNKVIGQVWTLKDKGEQIVDDFDKFDSHIGDYGIVGLPNLEDGQQEDDD